MGSVSGKRNIIPIKIRLVKGDEKYAAIRLNIDGYLK
jgi:hypothetical protein